MQIVERTRSEQARLDYVEGLMGFNSNAIGAAMSRLYDREASKKFGDRKPEMSEVAALLEPTEIYKFGAFFERFNHAQMFQNSLKILEKDPDAVRRWLDAYNVPGSVGSLTLDSALPIPPYYEDVEIHTQPGSYHGEFAGILYHWMIDPFLCHRDDKDEMGWALAQGVPPKGYERILDLGCGIGKSTLPYCDLYPDAEVYGIDYAAPMLKYAHRLAEAEEKRVHYVQANAEETSFDDESFDLITAIWLFHEVPRKAMDNIVREAYRLLRPGGVFAIMESPPFEELKQNYSPLTEFLIDSTGRRMSDPFIPMFFSLDRSELVSGGGFDRVWEQPLPNALTGWDNEDNGDSYFFGAFPWWMTAGVKE